MKHHISFSAKIKGQSVHTYGGLYMSTRSEQRLLPATKATKTAQNISPISLFPFKTKLNQCIDFGFYKCIQRVAFKDRPKDLEAL